MIATITGILWGGIPGADFVFSPLDNITNDGFVLTRTY